MDESDELKELEDIKELLILQLLASDVKAGAIADVLGIDKGNFSRMFPAKKLKGKTASEE